ncbi:MAG: phage tail protein [Humibacillus sp.]
MRTYSIAVTWDGAPVSGVTALTPLRSTTEIITVHDGGTGATFHVPGRSDTAVITVSRGVTDDLAFDLWTRGPLLRRDIEISLVDASDGLTVTYRVTGCWVTDYTVAPDLESGAAVESLSLSTGRWQRVTPPVAELADHLAREGSRPARHIDVAEHLSTFASEASARLDALLAEAEGAGAVLLLDEADALFARRTEVRDAHDRYADATVDSLLQRLSAYKGQVLVEPPEHGR